MTKTGTVTLVYGPQGAGKTTHARRIAADSGAVIFSIDEWMRDLFAEDLSGGLDFAWIMARVRRCETRIWSACAEILNSGGNVALDLGFMRRDDRERFRSLATAAQCPIDLHFVDAEAGVRIRPRTQRRPRRDVLVSGNPGDVIYADIALDCCASLKVDTTRSAWPLNLDLARRRRIPRC